MRRREKKEQDKDREAAEYLQRLETDAKKLRSDLHLSRASEQELRLQVIKIQYYTSFSLMKKLLLFFQHLLY